MFSTMKFKTSTSSIDEFEEMGNILGNVDERLDILEARLSGIMDSGKWHGKELYGEVESEYLRIQKEYLEEASRNMEVNRGSALNP